MRCFAAAPLLRVLALTWLTGATRTSAFSSIISPSQRRTDYLYQHSRQKRLDRNRLHRLSANSDDADSSNGKARVRFTGVDVVETDTSATSLVDYVLSFLNSDIGSLGLGLIGLILLLVGRIALNDNSSDASVELAAQETRSNLLAVLACGAILVNGISKLDVTSAMSERVQLTGIDLDEPIVNQMNAIKSLDDSTLSWAITSLLAATPAKTAVFLQSSSDDTWQVLAMAGTVPQEKEVATPTPILDRFRTDTNQETYLPTLQALPGKTEFTYLPGNTQAALLLPVQAMDDTTTVLVLGANQARSFTPRNVAWCQTVATRLAAS